MSIDARLSRLAPALSARERAILVLGSLKDGTPEDPAWRRYMPQEQVREFNRYIGLMNVANRELSMILGVLARDAHEIGVKEAWLVSLTLWQEHIDEIRRAIRLTLSEPITESEHHDRREKLMSEWVPVEELAAMLAGDHDGWQDSDYEEREGEQEITDEAWDRIVGEKEREVRALVVAGTLPGQGKGKRLKVQMGPFNDLLWLKAGVMPEDYLQYRVLPDNQADQVEREKQDLQQLQGVLDWRPFGADPEAEHASMPTKLISTLREGMAGQLIRCWVQLLTAEAILREIAAEFGDTDPLKPAIREELEESKQELLTIQDHLRLLNMEVVLREPLEEELDEMRQWVKERTAI